MKTESTKDIVRSFSEKEARELCVEYIDLRKRVLQYLFSECGEPLVTGCPFEYLIDDHRKLDEADRYSN